MRKEDITPFDDKGKRHGYWEQYHENGLLWFKGNWIHGERHGYWEEYHANGELWYKGLFIHGEHHGYFEDHENGKINYKEYYIR